MNEKKYVVPMATMNEHPEGYELKFEIPGIGKGEAELHVENRTLVLRTHAQYQAPAGFKQVAAEFERVNYAVSVDLPETADPATLEAKLENGVLCVSVKKRPETQARAITIT